MPPNDVSLRYTNILVMYVARITWETRPGFLPQFFILQAIKLWGLKRLGTRLFYTVVTGINNGVCPFHVPSGVLICKIGTVQCGSAVLWSCLSTLLGGGGGGGERWPFYKVYSVVCFKWSFVGCLQLAGHLRRLQEGSLLSGYVAVRTCTLAGVVRICYLFLW